MTEASNDEQLIARELAALGEAPPSEDELSLAEDTLEAHLDDDVRNVQMLVRIGYPREELGLELLPLAQRRVWSMVAQRAVGSPVLPLHTDDPQPAVRRGAWRAVVGALAVAAGVIIVPRLAPPTTSTSAADLQARREALQAVGHSARAAVDALPGAVDGQRARSMADAYAQRLAQRRGAPR